MDNENETNVERRVNNFDRRSDPPVVKKDNGKFLKIYAIALFFFAATLVGISIYMQFVSFKNIQQQVQNQKIEIDPNHPLIQTIQQVNDELQRLLDEKTVEYNNLKSTTDENALLEQAKIDNLAALSEAQYQYYIGNKKNSREKFAKVNRDILPTAETQAIYDYLTKKLK